MANNEPLTIQIVSALPQAVHERLYTEQAKYVHSVRVRVVDTRLLSTTRALLLRAYTYDGRLLTDTAGMTAHDVAQATIDARGCNRYMVHPTLCASADFITVDTPLELTEKQPQMDSADATVPLEVLEPVIVQLLERSAGLHETVLAARVERDRLDAIRQAEREENDRSIEEARARRAEQAAREALEELAAEEAEEALRAQRIDWLQRRLATTQLTQSESDRLKATRLPYKEMVTIVRNATFACIHLRPFRRFDRSGDPEWSYATEVRTVHTEKEHVAYQAAIAALADHVAYVRSRGIPMEDVRVEIRRHIASMAGVTLRRSSLYCVLDQYGLKLSREFDIPDQELETIDHTANTDESTA